VSGVVDGGRFVWRDENQRPVAIAQIFLCPGTEKLWLHEFQSLALERMKFEYNGRTAWAPASAGIKFESFKDAIEPNDRQVPDRQVPGTNGPQGRSSSI